MLKGQISRFEKLIAKEEKLAAAASSSDLALAHQQVAMLLKSELAIYRKWRTVTFGEDPAKTA